MKTQRWVVFAVLIGQPTDEGAKAVFTTYEGAEEHVSLLNDTLNYAAVFLLDSDLARAWGF